MSNDAVEYHPPLPDRVARRALVLCGVSCRGMLEGDAADADARSFWNSVRSWIVDLGIDSELESAEAKLIATPLGELPPQQAIDAGWRSEAMAVLAWALQRSSLPKHDEQVDPRAVADALGFLLPVERTVLVSPRLCDVPELEAYADVAFTVHWRLRQFSLIPEHMNFVEFSKTAWFGPLSLEGVRVIRNDLAIGGDPIAAASEKAVRHAQSIAQERHQAVNWLLGHDPVYSDVDTST